MVCEKGGFHVLSSQNLIDLYTRYGFELGYSCDGYLVFFGQKGYFQNAEIVLLRDDLAPAEISKAQYEEMGYSVRVRSFKNVAEVHDALFSGFFNTKLSNNRLLREYDAFCRQQQDKLLGSKYEYVAGDFIENGILQNENVIQHIQSIFDTDEPQLIILEASAGYGKTCTSFEVVKFLVSRFPSKIPLMAELSKNRKASIFRYVLLSEIDQKFPSLSSDLVTYEMGEGRIFLIIDGFDELLSKSYLNLKDNSQNKDAQTMLDTIAQLFSSGPKTKILLTTRKSSIFVGDEFDDWVGNHLSNCNVTRIQLTAPSLRDWIGPEKIETLKRHGIELDHILNPVLLSLLRSVPLEDFEAKYSSNDQIIQQYIQLLLKREQVRQSLPLAVDEQLSIMSRLAAEMVRFDISAEDIEFIKAMLEEIVADQLPVYLGRYEMMTDVSETKPSESEFLTKLSHHALLDRVSSQSNQIGFLNDFIFGLMIVQALERSCLLPSDVKGKYLDLAITALSAASAEKRNKLYGILSSTIAKETPQRKLNASILLLKSIQGSYESEYFDGIYFGEKISIVQPGTFKNSIFTDCVFNGCEINTDAFKTCQFYNCSFYNVQITAGKTLDCELIFLSCYGHQPFAQAAYREAKKVETGVDYERTVLEQYWKPGYDMAEPRRAYQTLLRGVPQSDKMAVSEAIASLIKKGILIERARVIELNFEKMEDIKRIIHR